MSSSTPRVALTIAGSDPSGGAGIQADLKTFAALGVHGAAVLAALTAQNTHEVRGVHAVPPSFIAAQIEAVFDDLEVAATKVGMLGGAAAIGAVAERLRARAARNIVLDPVMVSKSGARLLEPDAIGVLTSALVPLARVLTPNLPEAAVLLACDEASVLGNPRRACEGLLALGCSAVVLKGGHSGGSASNDLFFDGAEFSTLEAQRVETANTHGTGCTFSAAIAAELARGATPLAAVRSAKSYVDRAIRAAAAWRIGHGHGPVHHFHAWW